MKVSEELKSHIRRNLTSEDYRVFPTKFGKFDTGKYGLEVTWEEVTDAHLEVARRNMFLASQRVEARKEVSKQPLPILGDVIKNKDGSFTRLGYVLANSAQEGAYTASYYISKSGVGSYSGGLDTPVPFSELIKTSQTTEVQFWFFSKDWAGGNRGVYFDCPVTVWERI